MINDEKDLKRICKRYTEIENYETALNDKTQIWVCHHRREVQDGFRIWKKEELINVGQYYNREPDELIFMKLSDHITLHNLAIDPKTKKPCCYRDRDISGKKNPMYGKIGPNKGKKFSKETKIKLSGSKSKEWLDKYNMTRSEVVELLKDKLTVSQIRYLHQKDKLKSYLGG